MKIVAMLGILSFLTGGCMAVDSFNLLSASMVIGGLLIAWFASQFWDWEDITKDTIDFGE